MSIDLYGLPKEPFDDDFFKPLDCPSHESYYVRVDGFGEQKSEIDKWAQTRMTKNQFFLIHGNSGTGCTTVSNYIASKFAQGDDEILKVPHKTKDNDHKGTLHEWMEIFAEIAERNGIEKIYENFSEIKLDNSGHFPREMIYMKFLSKAIKELQAKNKRLVAIFESIKNPEIFSLVRDIFNPPEYLKHPDILLVIFTTSVEQHQYDFQKINPSPKDLSPIKLRHLSGHEVVEFIKERWIQLKVNSPHPFDEEQIKKLFDITNYPFKRVVKALEYIFHKKLKSIQGGGGRWPQDKSLKIDRQDIAISLFEFVHQFPE